MGLPPAHRVDHTPVYILSFDSAWNHELLNKELKPLKDNTAKVLDHPWVRYRRGLSRADLSTVQHYLVSDPPSPAVKFTFRRMTLSQWEIVQARLESNAHAARHLALQYSLASIDGAECLLERGGTESGRLSADDLDRVRALVSDEGLEELGDQAIAVSRELLDVEKKP